MQYGQVWWKGRHWLAHRKAWVENRGAIPKGLCVLHKCDVPLCIEISHLVLGTRQENMDDKVRKGRQARAKIAAALRNRGLITRDKADEIRAMVSLGWKQVQIAVHYGISPQYVNDIVKGREHA